MHNQTSEPPREAARRRKSVETVPLESFMDERESQLARGNGSSAAREPSATHLISGIVHDAQRFMSAYGELLKHDVRSELSRSRNVAIAAALAAAGAGAALLVLCLAAAHGATLAFGWSLATSYAVVGGAVLVIALGCLLAARRTAARVTPPKALQEAKEDLEWMQARI